MPFIFMMIHWDVFDKPGGFNENYHLAFSDVEICLQTIQHGYQIPYTPFARLIHYEGRSRGRHVPYKAMVLAFEHAKNIVQSGDPYFNLNLSQDGDIPSLSEKAKRDPVTYLLNAINAQRIKC